MRIVIIDCATAGVSGDKMLAAAVHAGGIDVRHKVEEAINSIVGEGKLYFEETGVDGLRGLRVVHDLQGKRHIEDLIGEVKSASFKAGLSTWGVGVATRAAKLIIEAEMEVHGRTALHELGEIDTIIDIVGTVKAFEESGLIGAEFFTTPVRVGAGYLMGAHGVLPIPTPATLQIARKVNMPILYSPMNYEYTTPTGAALLAALTSGKTDPPALRVKGVGLGVGNYRLDVPNITRVIMGEGCDLMERLNVVESNVDDVSGEVLGWLWERLKEVAEDVSLTPIFMKKCRPGFTLRVVVKPELKDEVIRVVMEETGTLGVKVFDCERVKADRKVTEETVKIGNKEYRVRVKSSNTASRMKPEFDDLKRIAVNEGKSLREVMEEVIRQVREKYQEENK